MELNNEQQAAVISQLREKVSDVLTPERLNDDRYLLRWLRARDYNVDKAAIMLKESTKWRKENDMDNFLKNYTMPELIKKYFSMAQVGFDKDGSPLWISRLGRTDTKALLQLNKVKGGLDFIAWIMEETEKSMAEQSKKLGKDIEQATFILDMDESSMRQVACREVIDIFRKVATSMDNNYPEILKKVVILNASKVVQIGYALIKPLIHPNTSEKFDFQPNEPAKWRALLTEMIDAEVLPPYYGGIREDGSGDPYCTNLIQPGGPVPDEFKDNPGKKLAEVDGVETITINSGSSALVEADIKEPGAILKWIFGTHDHDIAFGVYRRTSAGLEEHLPKERVHSNIVCEEGELECIEPGTYVLAFDNAYSLVRSKKVSFKVEVLAPDAQLTERQ